MRSYLTLTREVNRGELKRRENASRVFLERRRLMAIRLRAHGKTPPEVCEILGVHQCSLRNWVNAFNKSGLGGLKPQEKRAGRKRWLSDEQISVVCEWLDEGPSDNHKCRFWTGKHLANAIEKPFGIKYTENGIYVLLKDLGYTRLVPKTRHHKADPKAVEEFKKKLPAMVEAINHPLPKKFFFQDESRFGLMTQAGRRWARKGQRPEMLYRQTRQYLALFASVCPETGEISSLISPYMNTYAMNVHLKILSEEHPDTCNIVVLDGAGWHLSKELEVPDNVKLIPLPPYSPQLNPIEKVWDYIKNHFTKGTYFEDLDEIEKRVIEGALCLHQNPELVKSVAAVKYV